MQIVGLERALNWLQDRNCPYWVVYDNDTSTKRKMADNLPVKELKGKEAETTVIDEKSVDDAVRKLKIFLQDYLVNGGNFYLWAKRNANDTTGGFYTWITLPSIPNHQPQASGIGGVPAGSIEELVAKRVAEALEAKKKDDELAELKERLRKIESGESDEAVSGIDRIFNRLEGFIPADYRPLIIQKLLGMDTKTLSTKAAPAVAGEPQEQTESQAQAIAEKALTVLADGEPNLHLILEKLADMKINNPQKYQMALSLL